MLLFFLLLFYRLSCFTDSNVQSQKTSNTDPERLKHEKKWLKYCKLCKCQFMGSNLVKFACIRRLVKVWLTRIGKISDGSRWHSNQQCHRKCDAWCRNPAPLLRPLAGTLLAEGPIKGNIAGPIRKSTGVSWVALSAVLVAQSCARQLAVLISQDVCFAPRPIHQWLKFVLLSQLF